MPYKLVLQAVPLRLIGIPEAAGSSCLRRQARCGKRLVYWRTLAGMHRWRSGQFAITLRWMSSWFGITLLSRVICVTWFLREESLLPTRGAETAATSVPIPRRIPEHAVSLPPVPRWPAVPALRPGPAGCSRKRGAPLKEQAILTPAPLHGSDAAEVPVDGAAGLSR